MRIPEAKKPHEWDALWNELPGKEKEEPQHSEAIPGIKKPARARADSTVGDVTQSLHRRLHYNIRVKLKRAKGGSGFPLSSSTLTLQHN